LIKQQCYKTELEKVFESAKYLSAVDYDGDDIDDYKLRLEVSAEIGQSTISADKIYDSYLRAFRLKTQANYIS